jgi:hypothetical protein
VAGAAVCACNQVAGGWMSTSNNTTITCTCRQARYIESPLILAVGFQAPPRPLVAASTPRVPRKDQHAASY